MFKEMRGNRKLCFQCFIKHHYPAVFLSEIKPSLNYPGNKVEQRKYNSMTKDEVLEIFRIASSIFI